MYLKVCSIVAKYHYSILNVHIIRGCCQHRNNACLMYKLISLFVSWHVYITTASTNLLVVARKPENTFWIPANWTKCNGICQLLHIPGWLLRDRANRAIWLIDLSRLSLKYAAIWKWSNPFYLVIGIITHLLEDYETNQTMSHLLCSRLFKHLRKKNTPRSVKSSNMTCPIERWKLL